MTTQTVKHDKEWLKTRIIGIGYEINSMTPDGCIGSIMNIVSHEYADHIATPIFEELAASHDYVKALEEALGKHHLFLYQQKLDAGKSFGIKVHDYEPHPLLADKEAG